MLRGREREREKKRVEEGTHPIALLVSARLIRKERESVRWSSFPSSVTLLSERTTCLTLLLIALLS